MINPGSPLSVLQLTDTHLFNNSGQEMLGVNTEKYFLEVLEHAFADNRRYDLLLLTGDLAQNPSANCYIKLFKHLCQLPVQVVCLPGNHDDFTLMQRHLNQANVSCKNQLLCGDWQIICLNSQIPNDPGGYLNEHELLHLEQSLQSYPEHFALIAVHHHLTATESTWMDTMMIENNVAFFNVLEKYPQAKLVITGHIHQVLLNQQNNFDILGTPSTCFQFTPKSRGFSLDKTAPGYREIFLYPDGHYESTVKYLANELHEININGPGYFDH